MSKTSQLKNKITFKIQATQNLNLGENISFHTKYGKTHLKYYYMFTLGGKYTMQYKFHVSQKCTLEICVILLTFDTPINLT